MKLNHLNLTVTSVPQAVTFLETYFGLRNMGGASDAMAGLVDDNGLVLTVMRAGHGVDVKYPRSFHVGFMQDSDEAVTEINRRLREGGLAVDPPRRLHGAWTFYFEAPGGFAIEVGH